MTATEHVIRWSTAGVVVGVAAVAAATSYEHAYALVRAHGEAGWTGRLVPLTVDGLVYASSMVRTYLGRPRGNQDAVAPSEFAWRFPPDTRHCFSGYAIVGGLLS
jgi:Protein of unknown function (DUF2637)